MAITILDYVKSVVGDKDLYTAEDCLASGVDILGGCQGCHATIAGYNAYPSTSGYWRCADCIGDERLRHRRRLHRPRGRDRDLPGLRQRRRPSAKSASPPASAPRGTSSNAVTAGRPGSYDHRLALEWLDATFDIAAARPSTVTSASARYSRSKAPWTQARPCASVLRTTTTP